jgi:hypothetical protein
MRKTRKQYGGDLKEAQRRVNAWIREGDVTQELDLGGLNLKVLPELPHNVKILVLDSNKLRTLPALPNTLVELHCSGNLLEALPALPDTLEVLDCTFNNLKGFPTLPANLNELISFNNPRLPEALQIRPDEGGVGDDFDYDDEELRILFYKPYIDRIRKLQKTRQTQTNTLTSHITHKKRLAFGNRLHTEFPGVLPQNLTRHIAKYMNKKNVENTNIVNLYPSNIKRNRGRKTQKRR